MYSVNDARRRRRITPGAGSTPSGWGSILRSPRATERTLPVAGATSQAEIILLLCHGLGRSRFRTGFSRFGLMLVNAKLVASTAIRIAKSPLRMSRDIACPFLVMHAATAYNRYGFIT